MVPHTFSGSSPPVETQRNTLVEDTVPGPSYRRCLWTDCPNIHRHTETPLPILTLEGVSREGDPSEEVEIV